MSNWSSPSTSPMKRPRLTQTSPTQTLGSSARDLLSGALNEAIRCKDEKEEEDAHCDPNEASPRKANGSPSKLINRGIRRKRRKDLEGGTDFHHTFVMKLFDRSVDLAQFNPSTSLYPVCRAWMRNEPSNTDQCPKARTPTPVPPSTVPEDKDTGNEVYSLPSPEPYVGDHCPRIPAPQPLPALEGVDLELQISDSTPPAVLLSNHMVRWWEVRKLWRQASIDNEKRYEKSLSALKDMFDK